MPKWFKNFFGYRVVGENKETGEKSEIAWRLFFFRARRVANAYAKRGAVPARIADVYNAWEENVYARGSE